MIIKYYSNMYNLEEYTNDNINYKWNIYNLNKLELIGCFSPHFFVALYTVYNYFATN